jgi:S1-C subfamily serine protease/Flp pilus assembly protein TadD
MLSLLLILLMLPISSDLYSRLVASTAWLQAGNRGSGTAWVVDSERHWLITARHVVGDEKEVKLYFPAKDGQRWQNAREFYEQQASVRKGRVVHLDEARDLALIECLDLPETAIKLPLSDVAPVGTAGYLVGQRQDTSTLWTLSSGSLRQRASLTEGYFWAGKRIVAGKRVAIFGLPAASGDSGGAVCDREGKVIGILSAIANDSTAIVVEASEIRAFLAQVKSEPTPITSSPHTNPLEPLLMATVWINPRATQGKHAGVVFDAKLRLILTSAQAVGDNETIEILFPFKKDGQLTCEREHYRDLLGLVLEGKLVRGQILARDVNRDLAIIEAFELPTNTPAIPLAKAEAKVGDAIITVSHPAGLEVLWMTGQGNIRATARLPLTDKSAKEKPLVHLFQLPSSGDSSGGPITNSKGELIGILSAKEGSRSSVAYAATREELAAFLKATQRKWEPITWEEYRDRAIRLERVGQIEQAQQVWRTSLKQYPDHASIQANWCRLLLQQDNKREALSLLTHLKIDDVSSEDLARLALELIKEDFLSQAKPIAEKSLAKDSKNSLAMTALSYCTEGERSQKLLEDALFYSPQEPTAFLARAKRHSDSDLIIDDLSRAWELNTNDWSILRQRAALFTSLKKYPQALRDWQHLTELDPRDTWNWHELSKTYALMGNTQASQEAANSAQRVKQSRSRK